MDYTRQMKDIHIGHNLSMQINVPDAGVQTLIFTSILVITILLFIRKKKSHAFFTFETTNELKGFAILAIVLSHIGYFLSTNTEFLFPLSVLAGVGVDLFLFLSGFGLAMSAMKKTLSPVQFYLKRLIKVFIPLWIVLAGFFLLDWLVLQQTYPVTEVWQSFFGFFREADLFGDVNSPLWFITLIVFYYVVFPWFFKKEHPILSALLLFFCGYFLIDYGFETFWRVNHLHRLHYMALPLGVAFAGLVQSGKIKEYTQKVSHAIGTRKWLKIVGSVLLFGIALATFLYFVINSRVGSGVRIEQNISNITMFAVVVLFLIKPFSLRFLSLIGIYSYEIYLLHWPLLYRYDVLYSWLPAGVATALYVLLFLGVGFALQWVTSLIVRKLPV